LGEIEFPVDPIFGAKQGIKDIMRKNDAILLGAFMEVFNNIHPKFDNKIEQSYYDQLMDSLKMYAEAVTQAQQSLASIEAEEQKGNE
jgi:hypothetical protein